MPTVFGKECIGHTAATMFAKQRIEFATKMFFLQHNISCILLVIQSVFHSSQLHNPMVWDIHVMATLLHQMALHAYIHTCGMANARIWALGVMLEVFLRKSMPNVEIVTVDVFV